MSTEVLIAENKELKAQNASLRHRLEQLERLIFAAKSERHAPATAPEQMALWDQGADAGAKEETKEQITYTRKKKAHPGRAKLPEHLPVRRIDVPVEFDVTDMVKIGEEITRKVNYIPGKLEIIEYVRPKYALPAERQVEGESPIFIPDVPEQVLPKSIITVDVLVHIIVAKYIDHLPFYRQRAMFKREFKWEVPKSTINGWFTAGSKLLDPLYPILQKDVLTADYLQGDESRIKVLNWTEKDAKKPDKKNTHLGYMWVFRNPVTGNVFFTYRKGRGAKVLEETLSDFTGLLQSDGYSAYTKFARKRDVELVSCLAHIRRKFFEAKSNHPELAELALAAIRYLYGIEARCRERSFSPEQRQTMRRRLAKPAYEALLEWVSYHHRNNLRKGAMGKALKYATDHLPRLRHYLSDGRVEIDNNLIENKIRPLALGRKNYLFAGSHAAAQRTAMMYSLFASCIANDVNPSEWLRDVLIRIKDTRPSEMVELLPGAWEKGV